MSNTTPPEAPYDPCVAVGEMRKALQRIAMGESVKGVRYRNGEEERQTDFTPANVGELRNLLREAEDACHLATFGRPRRTAIRFSGRMCRSPFGGGM